MSSHDPMQFATQLAHFGEGAKDQGAVIPPIYQNSLFVFPTMEALHEAMYQTPGGPPHHYSRVSNPTLSILEQKLAHFEGADACKCFAAGMTAVTVGIMSAINQGSHVVTVDGIYGPTKRLLTEYLPSKMGTSCTMVDGRDTQAIIDACQENTTLIYLESPTSITFRLQDIEAIARFAKSRGIMTMVDNTYNTPIHQKPIELGIDVVIHSLTKYYGGQSSAMGGAVLGSAEYIDNLVRNEVLMMGALLPPLQAWLFIQGTRTLELRLKQHEKCGNIVAAWLEQQPEIKAVHHLGLASFAQKELYERSLKGSSGLFAMEAVTRDKDKIFEFTNRLKLFGRGISWGGFESLVTASHVQPSGYDQPEWFVRIFCGLEDPQDLINDISQALPALR